MRVLLLANSFPDESFQRRGIYNYRLASQFQENKIEVIVAFFRMWRPGRRFFSSYVYRGIKVYQFCLPMLLTNKYFFFKLRIWVCFICSKFYIKTELNNVDIIHSVDLCTTGIIGGRLARSFGKYHFSQAIGSDVNYFLDILVNKFHYKSWINNIDGILCNSYALECKIVASFENVKFIKTLYRGIDLKQFETKVDINPIKPFVFLFLGGFSSHDTLEHGNNTKGAATLANAWKAAEENLIRFGARLRFGGPGSLSESVKGWRNNLLYPESVEVIGELRPSEVKQAIFDCDVLIIPSMNEGVPNLLMECYACDRLVIGSNAGGIPEIIISGETGYVFNRNCPGELADLLTKVVCERSRNARMAQLGRERIMKFFNSKDYVPNILRFYREVIENIRGI